MKEGGAARRSDVDEGSAAQQRIDRADVVVDGRVIERRASGLVTAVEVDYGWE